MTNTLHNLDDHSEYFEFILLGNTYKFRYPTTEEVVAFKKLVDSKKATDEEQLAWIFQFIKPETDGAQSITEVATKMTVKQQRLFMEMVVSELTGTI